MRLKQYMYVPMESGYLWHGILGDHFELAPTSISAQLGGAPQSVGSPVRRLRGPEPHSWIASLGC